MRDSQACQVSHWSVVTTAILLKSWLCSRLKNLISSQATSGRVADHAAQVEQQVDFAGRFEFVQRVLFELFEIGDGEFAHDGDVDEVAAFFDGDHFLSSVCVGARRKLNTPLAMMSAMPSQPSSGSVSCHNNRPNRLAKAMVL